MKRPAPRFAGTTPLTLEVHAGCEFRFDTDSPSPSVLQVQPHPGFAHESLREAWVTEPGVGQSEYLDSFGNRCQRLVMPDGEISIRYDTIVAVDPEPDRVFENAAQVPPEELPDDTLQFLLPSRYCLPDRLGGATADMFADLEPGWGQVQAVCDWVHEHIDYTIGSTNSESDASTVYLQRQGVCRDYAHLAISFCRALNYPARYACGYLPLMGRPLPEEGMDFAAWMEVFVGDDWYTFDPRNNQPLAGRVVIGRGRDAVDVAMVTSSGAPRLISMSVWAEA